ncbi:sigma-70 family RNA polymerase sigma factor [Winogradskyella sp. 3972H.M.0a.05]|uniref:RNA polymerase sigma factor n=1 Tax=Winogradskyella sp. 3972H.M.0a.05 TaxID=2950277 RepID=UPI003394DFE7
MSKSIEKLIKASIRGNTNAQLQLYDNYCNAMFNIACNYLKNTEDAKDAMQEGFIKAYAKLDAYNAQGSFGAWLKRIIINQCIDTLKKKQLEYSEKNIDDLHVIDDDDWHFESGISKQQIIDAIEQLRDNYKLVVKLYLLEGYDHTEISEILDIPVKTSRTHLRRGRLKLKELLKSSYNEARY